MKKIAIYLIILLAFLVRFYRLADYPALNADEAAIGYNAYSLLQTGKDEHGNLWPIHFQSFNDYKPGLYFYLVLPLVKLIGLNEWAVRIPGAALGVATVLVVYLLVKELFSDYKKFYFPEFAALLLAISPWHIHFSRGGWEVNAATFLMTAGLYIFIKGIKNLPLLMTAGICFGLSLYTYHAARVVVPLLGIGILILYRADVRKNLKNFLLAGLLLLVIVLPLLKDFTRPEVVSRAAGVGLFADPGPYSRINEQRGEHSDFKAIFPRVLHNKLVNYSLAFLKNWLEHYHGEFLFLTGDRIQRNKVPETGVTYLISIIFLVIGFRFIFQKVNKAWGVILLWLLLAPTGAALTFQSPHALRAENMVIPLEIVSAYGLSMIVFGISYRFKIRKVRIAAYSLLALLIFWQFSRYLHMYWTHMSKEYPFSSQYGVKELVSFMVDNQSKYDKIIVTDRYDQPYILFLFYMKYPPEKFQLDHKLSPRDSYGFSTVRKFDKYEFRSIVWDVDQPKNPNSLIIGTDQEIPKEANVVKEVYGTNGYKYFKVVAN